MNYDTKQGILDSLTSYASLRALLNERHQAGYVRNERLNEFMVLGRLWLDTCGNASPLGVMHGDKEIDPSWADGHPVLTREEVLALQKEKGIEQGWVSVSRALPTANVRCATCGNAWHLDNFTDCYAKQSSENIKLDEYIGQPLYEVINAIKLRTTKLYITSESPIRNDKYIDMSVPDPKYPTSRKNERGYLRAMRRGHDGQFHGDIDIEAHIIEAGDEAHLATLTFEHTACRAERINRETRAGFEAAFIKAGLRVKKMEAIKNEYGSESYNGPWFNITTELGVFKVGWRKKVIELDWRSIGNFLHLFEDVNDTKDIWSIHAWRYAHLTDYLGRIKTALSAEAVLG